MKPAPSPSPRFDALRAAVPAPLDVLAAMHGDTFATYTAEATGPARNEDAERAACVAAAFPLHPLQAIHPAPFATAVIAVAYVATERALSALWDVEHVAEALRLRMLDDRPTVRRDIDALESLWTVLDNARRRAELAAFVAREAMEARPEGLPPAALARMLDAERSIGPEARAGAGA